MGDVFGCMTKHPLDKQQEGSQLQFQAPGSLPDPLGTGIYPTHRTLMVLRDGLGCRKGRKLFPSGECNICILSPPPKPPWKEEGGRRKERVGDTPPSSSTRRWGDREILTRLTSAGRTVADWNLGKAGRGCSEALTRMSFPRFCRIFAGFGLEGRPGPAAPSGSRRFPPGGGAAPLRRWGGRGGRGGAAPGARGGLQGAPRGGRGGAQRRGRADRCAHTPRCAGTGTSPPPPPPSAHPPEPPVSPHRTRERGAARRAGAQGCAHLNSSSEEVVGCYHPDPPICILQPSRNATGIIYYCSLLII